MIKVNAMPRDQQNWLMDVLGEGRNLLRDKLQTHLAENVPSNPDYVYLPIFQAEFIQTKKCIQSCVNI